MITTRSEPQDLTIPSAGGIALRGWHWRRPIARGLVVIAHGFGEHGGCYGHVAEALGAALEVDVLAPDFRGHGRSPGRRGVVRRYDELVSDLRSVCARARRGREGLPLFLLGHSNGGQVALRLALEADEELAGLILSNPSLRLAARVPPYKLAVARSLLRFAPGVTLSARLDASLLTRDPEFQNEHRLDPLRHSRMSAPLFFGMVEGGPIVLERAGSIRIPTLILLGAADPVIDPEESRRFFDRLGATDKTLMIYPRMLHEPLNEVGREQVLSDIVGWLSPRLAVPSGSS